MVSSNLADWQKVTFGDAFTDITAKATKVDQSEFLQSGKFPIVDQGLNFIAGYTDDEELVWGDDLPVVIFGDHTRILKYVDFPFVLGADGTKVLKPNKHILPLFAYYQLLNFDIPSAGYSRHFKFLKDYTFQYPSMDEQKRIASLLRRADRLRGLRRTAHDLSDALLQSVFLEMFGDPETNPKGWDTDDFEKTILSTQNGYGQREDFSPSGTIVLRIRDISSGKVDLSDPRRMIISEKELAKYALEPQDLIVVRVNGNPNYVGIASEFIAQNEPIIFSDHVIRIKMDKKRLNTTFIVYLLNSPFGRKQTLGNISTTAGQFTINSSGLSRIKMIYPPLSLQEEFAGVVARVERMRAKQAESERQVEGLFESLLAESFGGIT
jgi:type I restriction enzyme, S subunit